MMVMNMNKMIGMIRMIKMIGMIRMIRMIRMISMMVIMVMVMMVMVMMVVVVIVLGKGQLQPGTVFGHQGLELVSRNDHICTRRQLKRSSVLTALRKLDTEITGQRTHWQDMWMDVSKTPAAGALLRSLQIAEVLKLRCVAMCCVVLQCCHGVPSPETSLVVSPKMTNLKSHGRFQNDLILATVFVCKVLQGTLEVLIFRNRNDSTLARLSFSRRSNFLMG